MSNPDAIVELNYLPNKKLFDEIIMMSLSILTWRANSSSVKHSNHSGIILVTFDPMDYDFRSSGYSHYITPVNHGLKELFYRKEITSVSCDFFTWYLVDSVDRLRNDIQKKRNNLLFGGIGSRLEIIIMRMDADQATPFRSVVDIHFHVSNKSGIIHTTLLKFRPWSVSTHTPYIFMT